LAGFVEAAESLEEAVVREVHEESGVLVDIDTLTYHSSQPWPFPASFMCGFIGTAKSEAINVDPNELDV
jgi:NAD+ diphosphatase